MAGTDQMLLGRYMWYELVHTVGQCCALCHARHACRGFAFRDGDVCFLFASVSASVPMPGTTSGRVQGKAQGQPKETVAPGVSVPVMCRTLDGQCDCPTATFAPERFTRRQACAALHTGGDRPTPVLISGDSLYRDIWTTMALWLLTLEGIDVRLMAGQQTHAACFAHAWKVLDWLEATSMLKEKGFYEERNVLRDTSGRPVASTSVFRVCQGSVHLHYAKANRFTDLPRVVAVLKSAREAQHPFAIWATGGGLWEMPQHPSDDSPMRRWVEAIVSHAGLAEQTVYVGLHRRLVSRTPKRYQAYAQGPQGNARIRSWNAIAETVCGERGIKVVRTFGVTESLPEHFGGTEDGMHMSFWINLQKVQLLLAEVAPLDRPLTDPQYAQCQQWPALLWRPACLRAVHTRLECAEWPNNLWRDTCLRNVDPL